LFQKVERHNRSDAASNDTGLIRAHINVSDTHAWHICNRIERTCREVSDAETQIAQTRARRRH
jgi:hypothetical protein